MDKIDKMDKEYFEANKFKYTKPYKIMKDLLKNDLILFSINYNKYIYFFNDNKFYKHQSPYDISDFEIKFGIDDDDDKFDIIVLTFNDFIMFKVVGRWFQFTKKRKRQRIGLKLLEAVSPHLGNPIFMDFNV